MNNHISSKQTRTAGVLLGIGLGGFVDGIALLAKVQRFHPNGGSLACLSAAGEHSTS